MAPSRQVVVGTAGHIDHGKTSLVRALTGINTDRLPEEQARGISIDLGFAHFSMSDEQGAEIQFGIVDVPGHERFIRNMVAGSVGIDLVLFVVAADDAIMPQSREHLAILRLLNISSGIVVITKTDLVSGEHLQLVLDEVRETVAGMFLEAAPVLPVSSITGDGIELLRQTLFTLALRREDRSSSGPFRMPIDRVFTAQGAGCIVTGTVATGQISSGDELQIAPRGLPVRVRALQQFGVGVEKSTGRQRIAINLAGVKSADLCRGDSLVVSSVFQPTRRLLVELTACMGLAGTNSSQNSRQISSTGRGDGLRDRQPVLLHLGTREVPARLRIPAGEISPGEQGFGEIQTSIDVIAAYGESFIVRRPSPLRTLGGGRILDPAVTHRCKLKDASRRGSLLVSSDAAIRFAAACETLDQIPETRFFSAWKAGVVSEELPAVMRRLLHDGLFVALPRRGGRAITESPATTSTSTPARNRGEHVLHADRFGELAAAVQRRIREAVVAAHPARTVPVPVAISACQRLADENLIAAIIQRLVAKKILVEVAAAVGPADLQPRFTRAETALIAAVRSRFGDDSLSPPTANELAGENGCKPADLLRLMRFLAGQNELVEIADGLFLTPTAIDRAKQLANGLFASSPVTAAQLRDAWQTTRKFAVPLCEYLDSIGFTVRQGDLRIAGKEKTAT